MRFLCLIKIFPVNYFSKLMLRFVQRKNLHLFDYGLFSILFAEKINSFIPEVYPLVMSLLISIEVTRDQRFVKLNVPFSSKKLFFIRLGPPSNKEALSKEISDNI